MALLCAILELIFRFLTLPSHGDPIHSPEPLLGGSSALKYRACAQNQAARNSPADPADPADPPEAVAATAARTPPSTRAGGQDDVSLEQTPSNH